MGHNLRILEQQKQVAEAGSVKSEGSTHATPPQNLYVNPQDKISREATWAMQVLHDRVLCVDDM